MSKARFVTADEICTEIGIHRMTLRRWVAAGKFPPPLRLGKRKYVWLRREYESHIAAHAQQRGTADD